MATMEYKCPKCGAPISFNPDKQLFSCEYCGADTTVEEIQKLYAQQEQTETINEREVKHSEQEQQKAQQEAPAAAPEQILKNVRRAVDEFVKEAEQFDDLTMLCLEYRGQDGAGASE